MPGRRSLLFAPLGAAALGGAAFWAMLRGMDGSRFDPHEVSNPLLGQPVPAFDLPGQAPGQGFGSADLHAPPGPVLVNFFASWCAPCLEEAGELAALTAAGVTVWGIAYKDHAEATAAFLQRVGDPYQRIARDADGRVAIDWGVYGVPETYLVDRQGIVRWRLARALTPALVRDQLRPLLRQAA